VILHDFPLDDECWKVRLGLGLMQVPHALRPVDVVPGGEPETRAYLARNPLGRLPLWEEGALLLRDPQAILLRLAEAHDPARRFLPADALDRARMQDWLCFAARELWAAREARQAALFSAGPVPAPLARAATQAIALMEDVLVEHALADAAWFVGAAPSLADIALYPAFALSRDWGLQHEAFPKLRRWGRRFRALPGFRPMPGIPDHA
jgi:glutathione S-transferase